MNAGAVILTDCVFWFIIVPFLTIKDYNLNFVSFVHCLYVYFFNMLDISQDSEKKKKKGQKSLYVI